MTVRNSKRCEVGANMIYSSKPSRIEEIMLCAPATAWTLVGLGMMTLWSAFSLAMH